MRHEKPEMTEREFVIEYLLARAGAVTDSLSSVGAISEARKAWGVLIKIPITQSGDEG